MKKRYITSLLLVGLMPFLTNCASQQDVQSLNYHVRSINKKLEDMKVNTVDQMQQRQAMSSGQLDQLQNDILQLKSKLEENAHMNRMLQEQNKEFQLALQNLTNQQDEKFTVKMAELDSRLSTQKDSLTAMQRARVEDAERRSRAAKRAADDAMRKAQKAAAATAAAVSVPTTTARNSGTLHFRPTSKKILFSTSPAKTNSASTSKTTSVATSPRSKPVKAAAPVTETVDTNAQAMQLYRNGSYDKAFALFEKTALSKGSRSKLITARYMMGECLYKKGAYDQAIIQYQQIISSYPGNPQAAKALLRQGESFEQLSDTETASIIYKKITASYGSSPEAETARKKLSSL